MDEGDLPPERSYKRARGLSYADVPWSLRALSRFIASTGHTDLTITQALVDQWCRRRPNERRSNQHKRIVHTTQFLSYLAAQGVPVAFPQIPKRRGDRESFAPYVFTRRERDQLFTACDRLEAKAPSVMPNHAAGLAQALVRVRPKGVRGAEPDTR